MPEGYPSKSVLFDIEWNGDTSGLVSVADTYYKVANYTAVTKADLVGCMLSLQNVPARPEPFAVDESEIYDTQIPHAIIISDYAIFVSEPTSYGPANFTETGIYFAKMGEKYTARLSKQVITPMAEEFLPNTTTGGVTTLHINVTAINTETMETTFTADKTPLEMQQASAIGPTWCVVSSAAGIMGKDAVSTGLPPAWIGGEIAFGFTITRVHEDNGNNKIVCAVRQGPSNTWILDLTAFGS